jgi:hypothetical protein
MERELKELNLFSGPARLMLLTWENLDADLLLVARIDERDIALGDATDAAPTGLSATLIPPADAGRAEFIARLRSVPSRRGVPLVVYNIDWNGKGFEVSRQTRELTPRTTEVTL